MRFQTLASVLLLLAACGKLGGSESSDAEGLRITVTPSPVELNAEFTATVSDPDLLKGYSWRILDDEGTSVEACATYTTAEITCLIEFPGAYTVELDGTKKDGDSVTVAEPIDVIDPAKPSDQAPVVVLDLAVGGEKVASVATFVALEDGAVVVDENAEVTFDFSRTTDQQDALADLEFYLDLGQGLEKVEPVSTHVFEDVSVITATAEVRDPAGNVATKKFNVFVRCAKSAYDPVAVDLDGITVTDEATHNFFTYAVKKSAVTGGKGPYQVMWDLNGDGMYDGDWSEELSTRRYTVYAGRRNVRLKVWDTGCNFFGAVALGDAEPARETFVIPMADGVPGTEQGPQIPGYYFLQAELEGKGSNDATSANVDYVATQKIGGPETEEKRVICDYKKQKPAADGTASGKANFEIKGLNKYVRADGSSASHGMVLGIIDIDDSTGVVEPPADYDPDVGIATTANGKVHTANYYTDTSPDAVSQATYQRNGDCTYSMLITKFPPGSGTCATTPDMADFIVRIDGTFSCPSMKTTTGLEVGLETGAFYCEVAKIDACPPGGGGGGGGLPPIP